MHRSSAPEERASRRRRSTVLAMILVDLVIASTAMGAPFNETFRYVQPDGTSVELTGKGDEFSATFETRDGYTVIFDDQQMGYCYAALARDGNSLLSTGIPVGSGDRPPPGLAKHLRINPAALRAQRSERYRTWDRQGAYSAHRAGAESRQSGKLSGVGVDAVFAQRAQIIRPSISVDIEL